MITVTLKRPWLAPTNSRAENKITTVSGKYFAKGTYRMPDAFRKILPSTAEIHEDKKPRVVKQRNVVDPDFITPIDKPEEVVTDEDYEESLKDHDLDRANADAEAAFAEEEEEAEAEAEARREAKRRAFAAQLAAEEADEEDEAPPVATRAQKAAKKAAAKPRRGRTKS